MATSPGKLDMSTRIMSELYINSINCVILVVALALIILIYVVFIGLYCLMGGCGVVNVLKKILSWLNCKPIQILFQGLSYFCIVYTLLGDKNREGEELTETVSESLSSNLDNAISYSLVLSLLGLLYLVHSSYVTLRWFNGERYPTLCFSPSELKTFLSRIQATEPMCNIKVSGGQCFPPNRTTLTKDFVPHLWTEFTESIDVVGARKNRIESAINISDVLEELLRKNKVFIMDISIDLMPEDRLSSRNTHKFVSKVLDTASTKFRNTTSASYNIQIPTISSSLEIRTPIQLKDGALATQPEDDLLKMNGPKMSAIVHRELDLPAFWYFMWKQRHFLQVISTIFPPLGIFFNYLLEDGSQRHNLDITIKYSFVPQTDPPYQLDKSVPDIDFSEPQKITILMPCERFLVPRDSLSRIITGEIDWRQNRHLRRTPSTESSPPILTPHTSNMAALLERTEEYSRRSRNSSTEDAPHRGMEGDSPPSYTAVFIKETEGLTPPPDYSNCKPPQGTSKSFF